MYGYITFLHIKTEKHALGICLSPNLSWCFSVFFHIFYLCISLLQMDFHYKMMQFL